MPLRRLTTPKNKCSRLRETLLFKNVPLQVLVSSTRNATFKKQVASRLRETLVFFENCALVYAKHYFFASRRMGLSRQAPCASWKAAPRRPGPVTGQSCQFFCAPSAAKWHEQSGPKFWPGLAGSLNVRARPVQSSPIISVGFLSHALQGPTLPLYGPNLSLTGRCWDPTQILSKVLMSFDVPPSGPGC